MRISRISIIFLSLSVQCLCAKNGSSSQLVPELGGDNERSYLSGLFFQSAVAVNVIVDEGTLKLNDVVFLHQYDLLANSTVDIVVENHLPVPEKFFYYFQTHSYLHEVVLIHNKSSANSTSERGSNIGHIFFMNRTDTASTNHTLTLGNENEKEAASIILVLLVYEVDKTPVPGACLFSSSTEKINSPSVRINTLEDVTSVSFQPGTVPGPPCQPSNLITTASYEIRYIYLGKNEYSPSLYFDTLKGLLVANRTTSVGEKFPNKVDAENPFTRLFSRYAGMGLFVIVIMRDTSNESFVPISYVPSVSYGCPGSFLGQIHCDLIENTTWKVIYILIMLIGTGILIFGRGIVFVRATIYSLMIGAFVLYTLHSTLPFAGVGNLIVTIGLAVILILTWICVLLRCHAIYRLTDFMAAVILGYTLSCVILFGSSDAEFLVNTSNYYLLLAAGILLIAMWYFSLLAVFGVIILNVLVGSVFIVSPLLFIFDGTLQYAFVNNWRRIRDEQFRFALCFPHLEVVDWISIALWMVIFCFGLCFQRKCQCSGNARQNRMTRIFRDPEQRPLIARMISSGDSNDVFLSPRSNSDFLSLFSRN